MKEKTNINNPNNYTFNMYNSCMIKECLRPACWYADFSLGISLCDKCFKKLEKDYDKK